MPSNLLKSSLEGTYLGILFQIFCRCVTFGMNSFILRNVGRDIFGIINVRLLLLESTLLYLSREATRRAALSYALQKNSRCNWAQLVNHIWLTVPTCAILCIPCVYTWINLLSPVDREIKNQYNFGCFAVALSCIIELLSETPTMLTQIFCFVKVKIALDTIHLMIRSIVFTLIVLYNKESAVIAFGIAQITSAVITTLGFFMFFAYYTSKMYKCWETSKYKSIDDFPFKKILEMVPGLLTNEESKFNTDMKDLTLSFLKQGVLKQVLTEGEKYVMTVSPVLSFSEQATYDVVNNLGSIAARFFFRPIEDSCYFYFTQTISRKEKLLEQDKQKVLEAANVLKAVLRVVTSVGLFILTFGQSYAGIVVLLFGGENFVGEGLPEILLRWHCFVIFFLAINGITEGYMLATNSMEEINIYNYYMAFYSVLFLFLSFTFTSIFGPVGFIIANCTNICFRIIYSSYFIRKEFCLLGINPLKGIIPAKMTLLTIALLGLACKYSERYILNESAMAHLVIGFFSFLIFFLAWVFENKDLLNAAFTQYERKVKIT